ncbi:MAG: signal recognition particle-docking protein FtsY [Oscillospiraceae bacterium]|nr:signal recognition particle-docking protein FtsY [Oscillospiraceae bacterium]
MGFFEKIAEGIRKTRDSMMEKVNSLLNSFTKIDEDFFEELEETLIMCDIGVQTSMDICGELRKAVKEKGIKEPSLIKDELKRIIADMLGEDKRLDVSSKPAVILVIGVNGAGKTTTIGKLAARFVSEGKKVVVAAADTFRAAAIDQLQVWVERAGAEIVKHAEGSDPAAVVFDAITAAKARNADIVICDTAGRLHNKKNLMDELKKITRICRQQAEGCSLETLLVLDATTGQNAVNQAKLFSETADITGIVLTKLDGTAKGGIIITIHRELGIPVKLVGVGEKVDDLMDFSAHDYAEALFVSETDFSGNYERLTGGEDEFTEDNDIISEDDISEDNAFEEAVNEEDITEEIIPEEVSDSEDESEEAPEESFAEEDISDEIPVEENDDNAEIANETDDISEEEKPAEKKSLKDGKFGFLFKEITFGKKKKDEDE